MYINKEMKTTIEEGKKIVKEFGYWSKEVYNFNNNNIEKFNHEQYQFIKGMVK